MPFRRTIESWHHGGNFFKIIQIKLVLNKLSSQKKGNRMFHKPWGSGGGGSTSQQTEIKNDCEFNSTHSRAKLAFRTCFWRSDCRARASRSSTFICLLLFLVDFLFELQLFQIPLNVITLASLILSAGDNLASFLNNVLYFDQESVPKQIKKLNFPLKIPPNRPQVTVTCAATDDAAAGLAMYLCGEPLHRIARW